MSALGDYSRGNLGREWGRPHSLARRRFIALRSAAVMIGSWVVCLFVAGVAFYLAATPFLGTILRFLDPPAVQRQAEAPHPPDTMRRQP